MSSKKRMSPQFAKEFAKTLVDNLNLFEETHGKIKLPKVEGERVSDFYLRG